MNIHPVCKTNEMTVVNLLYHFTFYILIISPKCTVLNLKSDGVKRGFLSKYYLREKISIIFTLLKIYTFSHLKRPFYMRTYK